MATTEHKTFGQKIRAWHRDLGFFIIGITLVYALSGIVLVYRDHDFLNRTVQVEKQLPARLAPAQLQEALRMREFKVTKTEGDTIYFKEGTYRADTGLAAYTTKEMIYPINKFVALHKTVSKGVVYIFTTMYGLMLAFMAVSSFYMFNPGSGLLRRGLKLAGAGLVVTLILLHL